MPHSDQPLSKTAARFQGEPIRVLFIPDVGTPQQDDWQSWLATQYKGSKMAAPANRTITDLSEWSSQIDKVLNRSLPETIWIAVAHGFGCLALAHHLDNHLYDRSRHQARVHAALMVAPSDSGTFGQVHRTPQNGLGIPSTVIGSDNDPCMPVQRAQEWASLWGARFHNLGLAGHIDAQAGFGPWPLARFKVDELIRDQQRQKRLARAHPLELNYAV